MSACSATPTYFHQCTSRTCSRGSTSLPMRAATPGSHPLGTGVSTIWDAHPALLQTEYAGESPECAQEVRTLHRICLWPPRQEPFASRSVRVATICCKHSQHSTWGTRCFFVGALAAREALPLCTTRATNFIMATNVGVVYAGACTVCNVQRASFSVIFGATVVQREHRHDHTIGQRGANRRRTSSIHGA
jgi:hypothetical protein